MSFITVNSISVQQLFQNIKFFFPDYDKGKCQTEFENYRSCKGFWNSVSWARRREVGFTSIYLNFIASNFQGLYPLVPISEEERAAFKRQYARTGTIPTTLEDS